MKSVRSIRQQFVSGWREVIHVGTIAKCSTARVILKRTCGKHFHCLTLKAANRTDEKFGCHLCAPKQGRGARSKPSEWECLADSVIRDVFQGARVVTQTKVLPDHGGAVDFMVEWGGAGRLLVEVDGEQHHRGGYYGLRHEVQRAVDGDKDEAALELGAGLVRLHCWDSARWAPRLKAARKLAQRRNNRGFVLYTSSYKTKDIVL